MAGLKKGIHRPFLRWDSSPKTRRKRTPQDKALVALQELEIGYLGLWDLPGPFLVSTGAFLDLVTSVTAAGEAGLYIDRAIH